MSTFLCEKWYNKATDQGFADFVFFDTETLVSHNRIFCAPCAPLVHPQALVGSVSLTGRTAFKDDEMTTAADQFPTLAAHLEKLQEAVSDNLKSYLQTLEVPDKVFEIIKALQCADIWLGTNHDDLTDVLDWLKSTSEELSDAQIWLSMEMDGARAKTLDLAGEL